MKNHINRRTLLQNTGAGGVGLASGLTKIIAAEETTPRTHLVEAAFTSTHGLQEEDLDVAYAAIDNAPRYRIDTGTLNLSATWLQGNETAIAARQYNVVTQFDSNQLISPIRTPVQIRPDTGTRYERIDSATARPTMGFSIRNAEPFEKTRFQPQEGGAIDVTHDGASTTVETGNNATLEVETVEANVRTRSKMDSGAVTYEWTPTTVDTELEVMNHGVLDIEIVD